MSTVIRVKRKFNEEQAVDERIVLNIKRQRTDEKTGGKPSQQEEKTVLKFAGTVDQTENTEENILKLTKLEAEKIVSRKSIGESKLEKRLSENKEKAQRNRFTVLNFTRKSLKLPEEPSDELTIVDVEKEKQEPSAAAAKDSEYVYDIYIAEKSSAAMLDSESLDINDLSILDYNDYLYSCPRLTNDSDDDELAAGESSDSNDENYYKNDYPEDEEEGEGYSDDNESIGERQMRRAMRNFDIDNELSSDDDDDAFVHSVDAEGIEFEDDLDFTDVARFGPSYARYKRRALKEMSDDHSSSSSSGNDDE